MKKLRRAVLLSIVVGLLTSCVACYQYVPPPPAERLQILDSQLVNDGTDLWPWSVRGHAKNVSGRTLNYAEVRGQLYDAQNVLLESSFTNITDLPSGVTWEFKIIFFTSSDVNSRVDHATVTVGTCSIY